MNNAEKFKQLFGIYATELWAMPEVDFLKWLNEKVQLIQEDTTSDPIDRQGAIDAFNCTNELIVSGEANAHNVTNYINKVIGKIEALPSAQLKPIKLKVDRELTEEEIKNLKQKIVDSPIVLLPSAQPEISKIEALPSAQPEIIRCKDCKHWRQQTNYQGAPLSFGFCESDDMWRSLYGETYEVSHIDTDDDFYCGYAERRTDGRD